MGTLSKRPLHDFGVDIKERIEGFRSHLGSKLDRIHERAQVEDDAQSVLVRKLEQLTNALPASAWLALSAASLAGAITLKVVGRSYLSVFAGQLVPTFLIFGLYNRHHHAADHGLH